MAERYKIVRYYANPRGRNGNRRVIERGLTLKQAQAHCNNPETSSRTSSRRMYTARVGAWFDGYEKD